MLLTIPCTKSSHSTLNEFQDKVVHLKEGRHVVSATAGSGKTTTILARIGELLESGAAPNLIGAFTFAKKAAEEMTVRGANWGFPPQLKIDTLHALCFEIVRKDGSKWVGAADFQLDENGLFYLVQTIISMKFKDHGLDTRTAASLIGLAKAHGLSYHPEYGDTNKRAVVELFKRFADKPWLAERYLDVYRAHEAERFKRGTINYDDMLILAWLTLLHEPKATDYWQSRFEYLLIDEAQDSSKVQNAIVEKIGERAGNIMLIGDICQSIYKWRGAQPDQFYQYTQTYQLHTLPVNYRSTIEICSSATQLTKLKSWNVTGGTLPHPQASSDPDSIYSRSFTDGAEEAEQTAQTIQQLIEAGVPPGEVAVLARTGWVLHPIETALLKLGIPYAVWGGVGFFERKEVKDILAYLRVAAFRDPDESNIKRALNAPFRYIGKPYIAGVESFAREKNMMFLEALNHYVHDKPFQIRNGKKVYVTMLNLNRRIANGMEPKDAIDFVLTDTNYLSYLKEKEGEEGPDPDGGRSEHIQELKRAASNFPTVNAFLDYVTVTNEATKQARNTKNINTVTVASIHRCVDPYTIVETNEGLDYIKNIPSQGTIGTTEGFKKYVRKFNYPQTMCAAVVTTDGYPLVMTFNHKITVWDAHLGDVVTTAEHLTKASRLRLFLGTNLKGVEQVAPGPLLKVNADDLHITIPDFVTEDLAELIGIVLANGAITRYGLHISASPRVLDKCGDLFTRIFSTNTDEFVQYRNEYNRILKSEYLKLWFSQFFNTLQKHQKIPPHILAAPLNIRTAFVRGVFANAHYENTNPDFAPGLAVTLNNKALVQFTNQLLLNLGIVSFTTYDYQNKKTYPYKIRLLDFNAHRFVKKVQPTTINTTDPSFPLPSSEDNDTIPITEKELKVLKPHATDKEYAELLGPLKIKRSVLERIITNSKGSLPQQLIDRVNFYYVHVREIKQVMSETMCVEIPDGGRFIQNGFDGYNSKGLEWDYVFGLGWNDGILPHIRNADQDEELRLAYVCLTRARKSFRASWNKTILTPVGSMSGKPSPYLELGKITDILKLKK